MTDGPRALAIINALALFVALVIGQVAKPTIERVSKSLPDKPPPTVSIEAVDATSLQGVAGARVFTHELSAGVPVLVDSAVTDADGRGTGGFTEHVIYDGKSGHGYGFGDINGDGRYELEEDWWGYYRDEVDALLEVSSGVAFGSTLDPPLPELRTNVDFWILRPGSLDPGLTP